MTPNGFKCLLDENAYSLFEVLLSSKISQLQLVSIHVVKSVETVAPMCSVKKRFEKFCKITGKELCLSLFFNEVATCFSSSKVTFQV